MIFSKKNVFSSLSFILLFVCLLIGQPLVAGYQFQSNPVKKKTSITEKISKRAHKRSKQKAKPFKLNFSAKRYGRASLISLLVGVGLIIANVFVGLAALTTLAYLAFFISFFLAAYGIFKDKDTKFARVMYIIPIIVSTIVVFLLSYGIIDI